MSSAKLLFKTSDSLTFHIYPETLQSLLNCAKKNFFNFMYEHIETMFYKENILTHFGIFSTTEQTKMTYEEAFKVYNTQDFMTLLESLDNKKYFTLFTNYQMMILLDKKELVEILVYDFKLFLDIASMRFEDFYKLYGN